MLAGSVMRPLGGVIADRIGGTRSLQMVYAAVTVLVAVAALGVGGPAATVALFVLTLLCLGAGNGAVFQLVPQRFGSEIGLMTGLIGMAGGVGGFLLAAGLGVLKQQFGHVKVRYRGLAKNTAQLHTLFALSNLWMARGKFAGALA